ncbi:MAG: copper-binding protein [Polaromonas sp.]
MNILKNLVATALVATAALASPHLLAQPAMDMSGMKDKEMNMEMSSGEVKKIDTAAQKITLKHGEIKNMEMPGMTMVFKVQDPSLLDNIKVGDKVNFKAEKRNGAIVVTAIETVR